MIQTFHFRIETSDKTYHQTIYSGDVQTAVEKWLKQIENPKNKVCSFDIVQAKNIQQQYLNGKLQIHVDREPYFLSFQVGKKNQIVHIDKVNKGLPDFLAKVVYLATHQGGRKSYVASGYRPLFKFDGRIELTSGEQLFVDKDTVFPGQTVMSEIRILGTNLFKNYLFVGQRFEFSEALHLVGHGEIIDVFNPDLIKVSR